MNILTYQFDPTECMFVSSEVDQKNPVQITLQRIRPWQLPNTLYLTPTLRNKVDQDDLKEAILKSKDNVGCINPKLNFIYVSMRFERYPAILYSMDELYFLQPVMDPYPEHFNQNYLNYDICFTTEDSAEDRSEVFYQIWKVTPENAIYNPNPDNVKRAPD